MWQIVNFVNKVFFKTLGYIKDKNIREPFKNHYFFSYYYLNFNLIPYIVL